MYVYMSVYIHTCVYVCVCVCVCVYVPACALVCLYFCVFSRAHVSDYPSVCVTKLIHTTPSTLNIPQLHLSVSEIH